jgi:ubiquinone/menaquinone biosynthesis C-methylase UbiE
MAHAPGGDLASGTLVAAMWSYAATVLQPAQALKRAGLLTGLARDGDLPEIGDRRGLGPHFSRLHAAPVFLGRATAHDHLVDEFDRMAEVYDAFVQPFSRPIFDEALDEMRAFLPPGARVLDAGCGAGRELLRVARAVPEGEVVGVDLAAGMVRTAQAAARAGGLDHCAFFQADVTDLPAAFAGAFDLVYNSLAHHHYPDPPAAAASILRALRPGGVYCVVDPGPEWYTKLSAPIARWADPGWIGFHTPDGFRALFRDAGFARTAWIDLLPGFGLAVGQKAGSGSGQALADDGPQHA